MYFWRELLVVIWLHIIYCNATPISSTSSTATAATATPLVVPPSQFWDGNDGPWSSFFLRVGSPPQTVRVLISTSGNQPLVVLPGGCSSEESNCVKDRGGVFQSNNSKTWTPNNSTTGGLYAVALDPTVGLIPGVQYGSDTLALGYLGSGAPALTNQLIGGLNTTVLYTGVFGLNPLATNFSNDSPEVASYMSNLKAQNQIPSLSYGYSAGNAYRFNTVYASLTLGGYDSSLFIPNNVSFNFNAQSNSDLTINIKSITQTSSSKNRTINNALSTRPFAAFIDTTTPYLWLPDEVCSQFESQFGLRYDNSSGLYLVNDTLHDSLLAQNANITFTLGNATSSETVDIVLPYAAFNLKASSPLVDTPTRYFPLKRASTTSQVTLGRTFFQEAYIIADYERSTFSISQMAWNPNAQAKIISILPPLSASSTSASSPPPVQKSSSKVPKSTIIAATLCSAVFVIILITSIILIRQRQKKLDILIKSPPTPAPAFTFSPNPNPLNINPATYVQHRGFTPSPEFGSGSASGCGTMTSTQESSVSMVENNNRRRSTPVPAGLALAPISPMSPIKTQNVLPSSQNNPISPMTPGGPIPPRFSSLDRVASPTSYYSPYQVPDNVFELPAREEVGRTPVETLLQQALDQVLLTHTQESQSQSQSQQNYIPYQPQPPVPTTTSSPPPQGLLEQARQERRWTLHSPVYGLPPSLNHTQTQRPLPQIRIETQERGERTSTWIHSPIHGAEDASENEPEATMNRGQGFGFTVDIHPGLRTARTQTLPLFTQNQTQTPTQTWTQAQAQIGAHPTTGGSGRGRDLILEHQARMREWEAMRGPLPHRTPSQSAYPPPEYPPPRQPLPHPPQGQGQGQAYRERGVGREREGVASPISPATLDPMEYSWLRLH